MPRKEVDINEKPIPYDETKCKNKFWNKDLFDDFIPKRKGFITDNIYALRGTETPTAYIIWTSLIALSMTIKREAWLDFVIEKKMANLYVILIGQAGIVKKNSAIKHSMKLLHGYRKYLPDECIMKIKDFVTVRNQATPEALLSSIGNSELPSHFPITYKGVPIVDEITKIQKVYKRPAEMLIEVPELASMLGKQSYMEGMVTLLMDLYDNHEYWCRSTNTTGKVELNNVYTTFIGGTTPKGFKCSIPESAKGDGFLTRTIIVNVSKNTREFCMPSIPKDAPSIEELTKRLAWISMNVSGEYKLTKKALVYYKEWYTRFKKLLRDNPEKAGINSRLDHNLLKVALLIRANLYETGREITLEDMEEADKLIMATSINARGIINEITVGEYGEWLQKIENYIMERGSVKRRQILTSFSGKLRAMDLNEIINRLEQEGKVNIRSESGRSNRKASNNGKETYTYNLKGE